jgi:hypothetical protein
VDLAVSVVVKARTLIALHFQTDGALIAVGSEQLNSGWAIRRTDVRRQHEQAKYLYHRAGHEPFA